MTDETATPEATDAPAPEAAPADASLIAAAPGDAPVAPARPDGLPDAYWDAETNSIKPEAYSRLAELEAAAAAAREGVPESAEAYELTPDEPVEGPDGKPLEFSADDPLVQAVLPALHEAALPQAAVSKILGAYARAEVAAMKAEADAATERRNAEVAKLGDAPEAVTKRTSAVHGLLVGAVGAEHAEALRQVMTNADAFIALEALTTKLQGPTLSAAPLSPAAPKTIEQRLYSNPSTH